jgi:uncharacterized membrane protein YidH (DUF202 family)
MNPFLIDFIGAVIQCWLCGRDEMITNYGDHAANERTFLAWVRTGLAVAAFRFLPFKLNVLVDVAAGSSLPHHPAEEAGAFAAIVARYAGLAMVVTGITASREAVWALSEHAVRLIARSLSGFHSPAPNHCFRPRS